jgi:hypothetical protein
VSDEVLRLVDMLDGLNRYRFAGNAELRAAWESARNVVSGPKPKEEVAEAPKVHRSPHVGEARAQESDVATEQQLAILGAELPGPID